MADLSTVEGDRFDLDAFRRYGVFVVRGLFDTADTATFTSVWNEFYEANLRKQRAIGVNGASPQDLCETVPPTIGDIYRHPTIVSLIKSIYGENIVFCDQRVLIKDDHFRAGIHGHQDFSYYRGGMEKVALFVPLTTCHPRNGGLHFVLKSHKFGYLGERGFIPTQKLVPEQLRGLDVVAPTVHPGDVIAVNICTWHFSLDSETGEPRVYVNPYFQPATDGSYDTLLSGTWQTDIFWRDHPIGALLVTESQMHAEQLSKAANRRGTRARRTLGRVLESLAPFLSQGGNAKTDSGGTHS